MRIGLRMPQESALSLPSRRAPSGKAAEGTVSTMLRPRLTAASRLKPGFRYSA